MKTASGPYTFDGFGINAGDEYKSRIATVTPVRFWQTVTEEAEESRTATAQLLAASQESYNACLAAHDRLVEDVKPFEHLDGVVYQLKQALEKAEGGN